MRGSMSALRIRRQTSLATNYLVSKRFCEALYVRPCRSLNVISALVKRQSLQIADPLVRDPKVDAGANSRS